MVVGASERDSKQVDALTDWLLRGMRSLVRRVLTPHLGDPLANHLKAWQFTVDGTKDGITNSSAPGIKSLVSVPFVSTGCDTIEMSEPLCARVPAVVQTVRRSCSSGVVVSLLVHGNVGFSKVVETSSVLL